MRRFGGSKILLFDKLVFKLVLESCSTKYLTCTTSNLLVIFRSRSLPSSPSFFNLRTSSRNLFTSLSASSRAICARRNSASCFFLRSMLSASRSRTSKCSNRLTRLPTSLFVLTCDRSALISGSEGDCGSANPVACSAGARFVGL
jgi:hypothetical protein